MGEIKSGDTARNGSRDRDSKQLNDKIYSSEARLPSALAGFGRKGGSRRVKGREEGKGWLEETSAVHRRSLVQDFYPAELRRNLWMPFPYPQDTNSTLPTRLLSFYRSYIPRRNGCPRSISTSSSTSSSSRSLANRGVKSRGKRKLIEQRGTDRDL